MTIAVLAAMSMEAAAFIQLMQNASPERSAGRLFLRGKIGQADVALHRCGMGLRRADRGARALIAHCRPDALLLYGVSGGLSPDVQLLETVIVTASYLASGNTAAEATDEALAELAAQILDARKAPAAVSRTVTVLRKSKTRVAAKGGAACVDMESYAVAKAAREAGVPLLVLRAISDTYDPASLLSFFSNGKAAARRAAGGAEAVIRRMGEATHL